MTATNYILIHEDGLLELKSIKTLDDLQDSVQGIITSVPVLTEKYVPRGTTVFANDEGLLIGMNRNRVAETLIGYPTLVGPILIGGEVDDEGDVTDVDPDVLTAILQAMTDLIAAETQPLEV